MDRVLLTETTVWKILQAAWIALWIALFVSVGALIFLRAIDNNNAYYDDVVPANNADLGE